MKISNLLQSFPACITAICFTIIASLDCPRWESKLVRRVLNKDIFPIYQHFNAVMPQTCPFSPTLDIYGYQEEKKFEESSTKWVCDICGKAFFEERFLDQHFDNRHPETKREGTDFVCLASFCDIFRCDVIRKTSHDRVSYWDHALCKEKELQRKHSKCKDVINQCIPTSSERDISAKVLNHLNTVLCSYLTCDNYWNLQETEVSPLSLVYYIMAGMVLSLGMVIYYILLRSQLSQGTQKLLDSRQNDSHQRLLHAPENQEIRYRLGVPVT